MYLDLKSVSLLILIFLIIVCGIILYYRNYIRNYSEFPRVFYLGYVLKCILMNLIPKHIPVNSFFFQFFLDTCKKFQTEGLFIVWIFQPYLLVYSEEAFKILSYENTTVNKPYNFDLFKELFMDSLLTSGGGLWKKRRKMLNPVFYVPNLRDQCEMLNRNATLLVENISKYNTEASSNVLKFLKVCAFRNIYEFLTGLKLSPDENKNPEVNGMIDCVNKSAEMIVYRIFKPWLHPKSIFCLFTNGREFSKIVEKTLNITKKILERMKESFVPNNVKNGEELHEISRNSRRTFGQVILEQHLKDPTYSSTDMEGEFTGMLSAGYDTVSYALMWTLFLLGHHPDIQNQVYEEVESIIGHRKEVLYDDLENLKYMECVIKESLRIYPSVPLHTRRTVRDVQCGKYIVPKGTNILLCTYLMHRDPHMFPDPEKFDPERFLSGNSEKKLATYSFAEGVRNCIGKNFAMMELKIVLAHVIKNFSIKSLDRREDLIFSWEVVLTTVKPVRMCLTRRSPSMGNSSNIVNGTGTTINSSSKTNGVEHNMNRERKL